MKKRQPIGLLITDTHLKDGNEDLVLSIFEQAVEICKSNGLTTIYHLGDWFTSRKSQSLQVLYTTIRIRRILFDNDVVLKVMPGNHDKTDLNSDQSFLDFFKNDSFQVIPGFYQDKICTGIKVLWCPYYKLDLWKEKLDVEIKKGLDDSCKWVLFGHQAVDGAVNNDGSKVSNLLKKKVFDKFDAKFFGHYHNQSGPYIGSAYQANFGEDTKKGVTILYSDLSTKHIQLEFPSYVKYVADPSNEKQFKSITKKVLDFKLNNPQHIVRIELAGDRDKVLSLDKSLFAEAGIQVTSSFDDAKVSLDYEENEFKVFDSDTILEEFVEYAIEEQIDVEQGIDFIHKASCNVVN